MLRRSRGSSNIERRRALRGRPDLIEASTPDYEIGCKRVLVTSDWYPTLLRDDVELITGAAERVTPRPASSAPTGSSARPT